MAGGNWFGSVGLGSVPGLGRVPRLGSCPRPWVSTVSCPGMGGVVVPSVGAGVSVSSPTVGIALIAGKGALGSRL